MRRKVKAEEEWIGKRLNKQAILTRARLRQAYPIHDRPSNERRQWDNKAIKGFLYIATGKG